MLIEKYKYDKNVLKTVFFVYPLAFGNYSKNKKERFEEDSTVVLQVYL